MALYKFCIVTMFPLRLCGGKLLVAGTRERRYGPSRLRVNDDDGVSLLTQRYSELCYLLLLLLLLVAMVAPDDAAALDAAAEVAAASPASAAPAEIYVDVLSRQFPTNFRLGACTPVLGA